MVKGLTHKQRAWLAFYLGEAKYNATEAARLAGYKQARNSGYENLHNPAIEKAISQWWSAVAMGPEEVMARLAEQARGVQTAYLHADGTIDMERLLADGKNYLVKGTRWDRHGKLVIEFYDGQHALELIGRYHRLFVESLELTGKDGGPLSLRIVENIVDANTDGNNKPAPDTGGLPAQ